MHPRLSFRPATALLAALAVCAFAPRASAVIVQIDASILAEVQQFQAGAEADFESDFAEFRTTAVSLPIQVDAALLPLPEDAATNAFGALAFSDFSDPTLSPVANPAEFGLEAHVFSLDPFVNFTADASATETRLIVFSAEELDALETEVEREIESSVFFSGAVLIWTLDPTRDLSGLSVAFNLSVALELQGQEPETVFSTFARVQGRSGGDIAFQAGEGVQATVGGEELLTNAVGPQLAGVLTQELAALGRVHVILIPDQEFTYRYIAPIDEEFNLTARISGSSVNLPAGTGAGAVFGRSFAELADTVARFIGNQSDGTLTMDAMNKALADLQAQDSDGGVQPGGARGLCGFLGMEVLLLPLGLTFLRFRSRRKWRTGPLQHDLM